ncbi:thioesterase [Chryseobacterium nematophagum]|uniref:Thioesterase n=2 Tax=Chryseobacterium nematophagum TaxID=2305228 RepID=A0A3M7L9C3_9FLAO|nr:thioesterase [Chryseobacterium nematophagum]
MMNNINRTMSKPQIFLLHYAGGDRYAFRPLIKKLSPYFEVENPELPGRGDRMVEDFVVNTQQAKADLSKQIRQNRKRNVPYIIYGHSMGAILGIEICKIMEDLNDPPLHFIATGYPGPGVKDSPPLGDLPTSEFFDKVNEKGGISDEVMKSQELLDFFEPILRADFKLIENKDNTIFKDKVTTPIYAMMGEDEGYSSQIHNWENYTDGDCQYEILKGGHFFINQNFDYLAETIKNLMNKGR